MAQGRLIGLAVASGAIAALAACADQPPSKPALVPPQASAPVIMPPPPLPQPAPVAAPAPRPPDTCGAAALQYLVGKPHTDIPPALYPSRRRVVCSTCVTTQDYASWRQTITYDEQTGLVTSVRCG